MKAGFTLLELLVALAITVTMTGVIIASFASGVRVWSAVEEVAGQEAAVWPGLGVFERDLKNHRPFRGIPFEGAPTAVSFPVVLDFARDPARSDAMARLGTVRYSFDDRAQALVRHAWPFPGDRAWPHDAGERMIENVESILLDYAAWPAETQGPEAGPQWTDEWPTPDEAPMAVRIRLRIGPSDPPTEIHHVVVSPLRPEQEKRHGQTGPK